MKSTIAQVVSCIDGYDPDALRVDKACEAIRAGGASCPNAFVE